MENQKFKHRAVIKFLTKEGVSPQNIHERLVNVYQDQSPSYSTVKKWAAEFKRGRDSIEDDPRCGRPVEVMTNEVCDSVEKLVMDDRRIKVREIAVAMGISTGSVQTILHDNLACQRSVPVGYPECCLRFNVLTGWTLVEPI